MGNHWDLSRGGHPALYSAEIPAATYGYWLRTRGEMEHFGNMLAVPVLANPKLNPIVKLFYKLLNRRRLSAWRLVDSVQNAPAQQTVPTARFESVHTPTAPHFTNRPIDPADWITQNGVRNAVSFMPARQPSTEADIIPHLQHAAISGGFALLTIWSMGSAAVYLASLPTDLYLKAGIVALLISIPYAWYQWTRATNRGRVTLWAMETLLNEDIDNDGFVGEPVRNTEPRVITDENGRTITEMDDDSDISGHSWQSVSIAALCHSVGISKKNITQHTKQPEFPGQKVSQPQYLLIYNNMQSNGYMTPENELTAAGWDYLSTWIPESMAIKTRRPVS